MKPLNIANFAGRTAAKSDGKGCRRRPGMPLWSNRKAAPHCPRRRRGLDGEPVEHAFDELELIGRADEALTAAENASDRGMSPDDCQEAFDKLNEAVELQNLVYCLDAETDPTYTRGWGGVTGDKAKYASDARARLGLDEKVRNLTNRAEKVSRSLRECFDALTPTSIAQRADQKRQADVAQKTKQSGGSTWDV